MRLVYVLFCHFLAAILYNAAIHYWAISTGALSPVKVPVDMSLLAPQFQNFTTPQEVNLQGAESDFLNGTTQKQGKPSGNDTNIVTKTPHANESFSACLLVMDENFRLQEWLAYAYYTLPLRYVVVAVDPRSQQSPTKVLDLFRNQLNMTILEWDDSDLEPYKGGPFTETAPIDVRKRHRARQTLFYQTCMTHLYDRGHTWTALYDTDEFLLFEHFNQEYEGGKFRSPPSMSSKPGTVLDFIHQAQASNSTREVFNTMCYVISRYLHGGKEIPKNQLLRSVPNGSTVVPKQLDTLRWRHHNGANMYVENGPPKVIIDVSRLGPSFPLNVRSPHRPVKPACLDVPRKNETVFRINHYLGSWEAYSYREDSRKGAERSRETWELRSKNANALRSNHASKWLKGFYDQVGIATANIVLEGAGLPKEYQKENYTDWKFKGASSLTNYHSFIRKKKLSVSMKKNAKKKPLKNYR